MKLRQQKAVVQVRKQFTKELSFILKSKVMCLCRVVRHRGERHGESIEFEW